MYYITVLTMYCLKICGHLFTYPKMNQTEPKDDPNRKYLHLVDTVWSNVNKKYPTFIKFFGYIKLLKVSWIYMFIFDQIQIKMHIFLIHSHILSLWILLIGPIIKILPQYFGIWFIIWLLISFAINTYTKEWSRKHELTCQTSLSTLATLQPSFTDLFTSTT